MFVAVGCDIVALLSYDYDDLSFMQEGCNTSCIDSKAVRNGTCDSLHGCCEVSPLETIYNFSVVFGGSSGRNKACHYAFFSEVGWLKFSAANLTTTPSNCDKIQVPVVCHWYFPTKQIGDVGYCGSNTMPVLLVSNVWKATRVIHTWVVKI